MKSSRLTGSLLIALIAVLWIGSAVNAADMIKAKASADRQRVKVGEIVNFDASQSLAGEEAEIVGWFWDFNDLDQVSVNLVGEKVSYAFNRSGAYSVSLVVENDIGERDMMEIPVEVVPDAQSGPSLTDYYQGGKSGVLLNDSHTFAIRLEWGLQFNFRIDNAAGREISVKIYGYGPNRLVPASVTPYSEDFSFDDKWKAYFNESFIEPDWKELENATYKYDPADESMLITFTPTSESVYLAWAVPYTERYLNAFIERWEDNPYFFSSTIGTSAEGRPIELITVSDPDVEDSEKRTVWITGIQHGYEMAGGPACESIAATLLADTEEAAEWRKKYVYHMVPLMNVDAVNHGGYRYNMRQVDLNRNWDDNRKDAHDSEISEPEVAAVKRAIRDWVYYDQGSLDVFMDMHCLPASADSLLALLPAADTIPGDIKDRQRKFAEEFLSDGYFWRISPSKNPGAASAEVAENYARLTGVISFTIEHPLGYINVDGEGLVRNTPQRLKVLGEHYVRQIDRYFSKENDTGEGTQNE